MGKFTRGEIENALHAALEAGQQAGNQRVQELKQEAVSRGGQPVREECGNAMPMVKLDGRSSTAKALKSAEHTGVSFSKMHGSAFRGYYAVHARPEVQGDPQVDSQNISIPERSAEAIAQSIKKNLGLETTVLSWRN